MGLNCLVSSIDSDSSRSTIHSCYTKTSTRSGASAFTPIAQDLIHSWPLNISQNPLNGSSLNKVSAREKATRIAERVISTPYASLSYKSPPWPLENIEVVFTENCLGISSKKWGKLELIKVPISIKLSDDLFRLNVKNFYHLRKISPPSFYLMREFSMFLDLRKSVTSLQFILYPQIQQTKAIQFFSFLESKLRWPDFDVDPDELKSIFRVLSFLCLKEDTHFGWEIIKQFLKEFRAVLSEDQDQMSDFEYINECAADGEVNFITSGI